MIWGVFSSGHFDLQSSSVEVFDPDCSINTTWGAQMGDFRWNFATIATFPVAEEKNKCMY